MCGFSRALLHAFVQWLVLLPLGIAELDPAERAALVDLYTSTTVGSWTDASGWSTHASGSDPCAVGALWFGLRCTGTSPDHVS